MESVSSLVLHPLRSLVISFLGHFGLFQSSEVTETELTKDRSKLVKMVTGKPLNRFPAGNRFSERISGYEIYYTSELDRYLGALM